MPTHLQLGADGAEVGGAVLGEVGDAAAGGLEREVERQGEQRRHRQEHHVRRPARRVAAAGPRGAARPARQHVERAQHLLARGGDARADGGLGAQHEAPDGALL